MFGGVRRALAEDDGQVLTESEEPSGVAARLGRALPVALFIAPAFAIHHFVANTGLHIGWDYEPNVTMAKRLQQTVDGKVPPPAAEMYAWHDYYANLDYYLSILRRRGVSSTHTERVDTLRPGQRVVVWQPDMRKAVEEQFVVDTLEKVGEHLRVYRIIAARDISAQAIEGQQP